MALSTTKKLSSVGIIGMILSFLTVTPKTPWAFEISHQNLNALDDNVEYATASATPQMRRWIGGREAKRLFAQSVSLKSEPFEATLVDFIKNWMYDKAVCCRSVCRISSVDPLLTGTKSPPKCCSWANLL